MKEDSDSTVLASPGMAAASAIPDPADIRNHVQPDEHSRTRRSIHGD